MKIIHDPFPHVVHEDFFKDKLLNSIYDTYSQYDHGDYQITADTPKLNKKLQQIAYDKVFMVKENLSKHGSPPRNTYVCNINDSFFKILIKVMDPGTSHHSIHCDADWKQLTTIIYVSKHGQGTKFYSADDENCFSKEVEWKQNRGYSFVPSMNSWHNFMHSADAPEKRIVVMFTLANKRYYR